MFYEKLSIKGYARKAPRSVLKFILYPLQSQAAEAYDKDHPSRKQFQDEIAMISKFLPSTLPVEQITQILEGIVAGMSESDRSSKGATGQVLKAFWAVVKKGEVQDKKALGKMIGEMLKK